MQRYGSWRRGVLQCGILAGAGVLFVGGAEPVAASPCIDDACNIRAARLMFALEYSTAMDQAFDADTTRLERAAEAIESLIDADNGFVSEHFILGLMHFGSDPDPGAPNTEILGDVTGLRDGVKLDVPWYDPLAPGKKYVECTDGGPIVAALAGLPAPPANVGSWTRGALEFTKTYLAQSEADHPQDLGQRGAAIVLYTTGTWTDATGAQQLAPASANPAATASELLGLGMPTHVVNLGGAPGKLLADPLAMAGGTGQALDVDDLAGAVGALQGLIAAIKDEALLAVCEPSAPRVMVLLDASSAMLNVAGAHGQPGEAAWDQVREALAGETSALQASVVEELSLDEVGRFGLVAFGDPDEQKLVMQYDYCAGERIAWGLDPASSCAAPGCVDPYAPPPIDWTFQNGALIDPPGFEQDVLSHMPRCDLDPQTPAACTGSGRFTHLGLGRVLDNLAAYRAQCLAPGSAEPCTMQTPFINLLITDGPYDSTDAQVQASLLALFEAGVVTRVFGIGDAVDPAQLELMAGWGSGGAFPASFAANGGELAAAIAGLLVPFVQDLTFDECCVFDRVCDHGVDTDVGSTTGDSDTSDTGSSSDTTGAVGSTGMLPPDSTGLPDSTGSTGSTGLPDSNDSTDSTDSTVPTTSTTGPSPTSGPSPTTGPSPTSGSETGEPQEGASDEGCACALRPAEPRGSLLLLGLAALLRRRARGSARHAR